MAARSGNARVRQRRAHAGQIRARRGHDVVANLVGRALRTYLAAGVRIDEPRLQAALETALSRRGKRNAAIFMTIDDPYSTGLAQYFTENFEKAGGKIVATDAKLRGANLEKTLEQFLGQ